jgi:hypothetical protein
MVTQAINASQWKPVQLNRLNLIKKGKELSAKSMEQFASIIYQAKTV